MTGLVHHFPDHAAAAKRLAAALGSAARPIALRTFPDGESLVRVNPAPGTALVYCPLDQPDTRLVRLLLAISALRDGGAERVVLVAPYLGYMRQDMAFNPGEAVSQRVIGQMLATACDALVTVDPHLHRTPSLADVVPGIVAVNVAAAPVIAEAIAARITPETILVGPDGESRPWVEAVARPLGLDVLVGEKVRRGDRQVEIVLPAAARVAGRPVLLVDDLISSGGTLRECARLLTAAGARIVGAAATHCLASADDLAALAAAGIVPVMATDSVPGPAATIPLAAALAAAIRQAKLL
jgi:ribose-phosphate pyrophosphokinase